MKAIDGDSGVLIISTLPRGAPSGASALVAVDRQELKPIAVREIREEEYLEDPVLGAPGRIRHCRGVAQSGDRLYVALFNCIREYTVESARELVLRPGRVFTHPRAADLHGICIHGRMLSAASTGSNCVITWNLDSGKACLVSLGQHGDDDVRFPDRLAREVGADDWRDVLDHDLHLNGVSALPDGRVVVCSLTTVWQLGPSGPQPIIEEPTARMHDGCLGGAEKLLLTDASCGIVLSVDLTGNTFARIPVVNPDKWFVRGIGFVDDTAYVLASESMLSRQRSPRREVELEPEMGGAFLLFDIEPALGALRDERLVPLPTIASKSVAYGLLAWKS